MQDREPDEREDLAKLSRERSAYHRGRTVRFALWTFAAFAVCGPLAAITMLTYPVGR